MQFWDARCPNAVRSAPDVMVCGDGIRFDRKGRELLVASWRPDNQLQVGKGIRKFCWIHATYFKTQRAIYLHFALNDFVISLPDCGLFHGNGENAVRT